MPSGKKYLRVALVTLVVLFVGLQLVPVDRSNPPVTGEIAAPPEVMTVLRRACYDCHSNETRWPWYGYVAPVSWLVAHDVEEGRDHLNLSTWATWSAADRAHAAKEMVEEATEGEMPLPIYLVLHGDARLSADDLRVLSDWARAQKGGIADDEGYDEDEDEDDD